MKLKVHNLNITVGKRSLLTGLNLSVESGSMVGLVGPSGCGKTTLLNTLGLLLPAHTGTIVYNDQDTTKWNQHTISTFWRNHASFVIQDAGIDDDETALYNITLTKSWLHRKSRSQQAIQSLETVGLAERAYEQARVLSGGEQRRLAIARAIYKQASIIFADEPTASLDETNRTLVQTLLLQETKRGALVIISTHDQELAKHCTHLVALSDYQPTTHQNS